MSGPHTKLHQQLISNWCRKNPGSQTSGFWPTVAHAMMATSQSIVDVEEIEEMRHRYSSAIRPDAFLVNSNEQTVVLYEAVVTSPITRTKWSNLISLGSGFDYSDWFLTLIVEDVSGTREYELDTSWVRMQYADHPAFWTADRVLEDRTVGQRAA